MTTDREKLEKMLDELPKENSYFRKNVLCDLLNSIDKKSENLTSSLYIPQNERSDSFLRNVLEKELGYEAEYDEEYNPYHESYCYKIQIKR